MITLMYRACALYLCATTVLGPCDSIIGLDFGFNMSLTLMVCRFQKVLLMFSQLIYRGVVDDSRMETVSP